MTGVASVEAMEKRCASSTVVVMVPSEDCAEGLSSFVRFSAAATSASAPTRGASGCLGAPS